MAVRHSFEFKNGPLELAVQKARSDRIHGGYRAFYGKTRWEVLRVSLPGSPVRAGDLLTTKKVFHLARNIDKKAAHIFDMESVEP